jgi:hypothetical protein
MSYSLPVFNLLLDVWRTPRTPGGGAPDLAAIPCQLYVVSRPALDITEASVTLWVPPIILRTPSLSFSPLVNDLYKVVLHGSSYFFLFRWWEYYHAGFGNEYQGIVVSHCDGARAVPFYQ